MTGIDFLPVDDQSEFEVTVRTPVGSSLDGTSKAMRMVEADLKQLPGIDNLFTTVGADVQQGGPRLHCGGTGSAGPAQGDPERDHADGAPGPAKYRDVTTGVQDPPMFQGGGPTGPDVLSAGAGAE